MVAAGTSRGGIVVAGNEDRGDDHTVNETRLLRRS